MRSSLLPASLRYVDQVARAGSIQRAAKDLNIAASAIDRQVLLLEENLGVVLFERQPRGMRLTPAGAAIVSLARRWRGDLRRVTAEIRQLEGLNQGQVRIAAMDSHANGLLPRFVDRLAQGHPGISLAIEIASTDEVQALLLGGNADLIVAFNLAPRRDLHILWSTGLPFGCVVAPGHELARHATTSLQQVVAHPIALQSRALAIRRVLDSRYDWLFAERESTLVTNSLQLMKMLARSGRYVAVTSELDAAPELIEGSLRFVPVRDEGAEPQTVSIAIDARGSLPRIVRLVADLLATEIAACLAEARAAQSQRPDAGGDAASVG